MLFVSATAHVVRTGSSEHEEQELNSFDICNCYSNSSKLLPAPQFPKEVSLELDGIVVSYHFFLVL